MSISRDRFEQLVADALDSIPSELGNKMSNVAVMVEERGDTDNILGLYQGVPLTNGGTTPAHFRIASPSTRIQSAANARPRNKSWSRCDGP